MYIFEYLKLNHIKFGNTIIYIKNIKVQTIDKIYHQFFVGTYSVPYTEMAKSSFWFFYKMFPDEL